MKLPLDVIPETHVKAACWQTGAPTGPVAKLAHSCASPAAAVGQEQAREVAR